MNFYCYEGMLESLACIKKKLYEDPATKLNTQLEMILTEIASLVQPKSAATAATPPVRSR